MADTSNKRTIYDEVYYRIKIKHNSVCHSCKIHLSIRTVAYVKDAVTSNETYCKECITKLSDRYQYEVFGRIAFPKEEPLYISTVGHSCSQLVADYEFRTAIFRRDDRAAYLLVRFCPQCHQYFLDQQDYQNNAHILHDYTLIHTPTNKPIPGSRQPDPKANAGSKAKQEFHPFVVWSHQHPYQGGGCSGK